MRVFFWIVAVAASLVWAFWPRPFFSPDWKSTLSAAVAANDCVAIERLVDVLSVTGHVSEFLMTAADLADSKKCKFAEVVETEIANWRAVGKQGHSKSSFTDFVVERSPLGSRIANYLSGRPYSTDAMFRAAELRSGEIWRTCRDKLEPIAGGVPNRRLLAYALSNPKIPGEAIHRIAREQSALCAHEWVMVAKLMVESAQSDADFERAYSAFRWAGLADNMAPELSELVSRTSENLRARRRLSKDYYLPDAEELADEVCISTAVSGRSLWTSMQCAGRSDVADVDVTDVSAVYYARRAQRLGWRDVKAIESEAASRLSPECATAMRDLEAREAGDATDPRDFPPHKWPVGQGEACGEESRIEAGAAK